MKKSIALLLVLVMALSVVACAPSSNSGTNGGDTGTNQTPETPEAPKPNDDLVLDENDMGICPVCGGDPVQWTPIIDNIGTIEEAGQKHYYLASDDIPTANNYFLWAQKKDTDVCLHLNNKSISVRGFIRTGSDNDLNIMGNGTINYLADCTWSQEINKALFYIETGSLTIYGGTFKSDAGKPVVGTPGEGNPKITLKGDATFTSVSCTLGALTIDENVKIDSIEIGASDHKNKVGEVGKLWVAKTFNGEVKSLKFPGGELVDNKVPATYAAAMGAFSGKITTDKGVALKGGAGTLAAAQ